MVRHFVVGILEARVKCLRTKKKKKKRKSWIGRWPRGDRTHPGTSGQCVARRRGRELGG
jgi:hypothetical protein